jgi:hypothetical protein
MKLTASELDKGLAILKSHGCSDLFPDAYEIEAIEFSWGKIRPVLESVDLLSYEPRPAEKIVAPRQRYTTRIVTLIDPIDALVLNAFLLRIGPKIDTERKSTAGSVVFSTRINSALADELFHFQTDHGQYRQALVSRLKRRETKFVATADINDFYPRIYLHRLKNSLNAMLKDDLETRVCMRFLEAWSNGTSYGIPVGPHFAHLFAEATLHEVDTFLLASDVTFIRYIDDYVIFGDSEDQCLKALFLLGSRLQQTQGLSLNSAKTRVWKKKDFKARIDLKDQPDARLRKSISEKVFQGDFYHVVTFEDLSPSQKRLLKRLNIEAIVENALSKEALTDFSSIKFILNVLTVLGRPELTGVILDNLGKLHPVSSAVARFLGTFNETDRTERYRIAERLVAYIDSGAYVPEFQSMWLLDVFAKSEGWNCLERIRRIAQKDQSKVVRRQAILALGQLGDRSALLDVKVKLNSTLDWEQRAIVYACRALPEDERDAFFTTVRVPSDWKLDTLLLKSVVQFSKKK